MNNASLNFLHNDDLFTVVISSNEITRVIWRNAQGGLLGDYTTLTQLPHHLAIIIAHKIKHEYNESYQDSVY